MFSAFPLCLLCHTMMRVCFSSVCLKLIWGKPTSFPRALFASSFSIFADLLGTFPAVQGGLGLRSLLAFTPFTSSSWSTSVMTSTHKSSGLPYVSDKQSLPLVSTCCASLFPWPDHQQPPARAWCWVGIQTRKEGNWPARWRLGSCVSTKCCWLATNVTVGETGLFVTAWLRSPNSTEFLLLGPWILEAVFERVGYRLIYSLDVWVSVSPRCFSKGHSSWYFEYCLFLFFLLQIRSCSITVAM